MNIVSVGILAQLSVAMYMYVSSIHVYVQIFIYTLKRTYIVYSQLNILNFANMCITSNGQFYYL